MYPLYDTGGVNQPGRFQITVTFSILGQKVTYEECNSLEFLQVQNFYSKMLYFKIHVLPRDPSPLTVNSNILYVWKDV